MYSMHGPQCDGNVKLAAHVRDVIELEEKLNA